MGWRIRLGACAACVILSGCAASQSPAISTTDASAPAAATVTLQDAKLALIAARSTWKDPDSIRDSRIGEPYASGCWGHAEHWLTPPDACVCIATNARNSFGGYTGQKAQVALIKGRSVVDIIDARSQDKCSALTPWPEFDGATARAAMPPVAARPR